MELKLNVIINIISQNECENTKTRLKTSQNIVTGQ